MLKALPSSPSSSTASPLLRLSSSLAKPTFSLSKPLLSLPCFPPRTLSSFPLTLRPQSIYRTPMNLLNKLGFGSRSPESSSIPQGPDDDIPAPGQQFAQFGAGCFWGVELAFQRVPGVTKTEVGYSQGYVHNPTYEDVCSGSSNHSEVVRVHYDPKECSFSSLLDVFWSRHDPTTLNRQELK